MTTELLYRDEVYAIRGAVFEVYEAMGNGFAEEVYQQCLERVLAERGIPFEAKKKLTIYFKGVPIEKAYFPDFWCYGKIIVELKACSQILPEHYAQLDNYLQVTKCQLGLLVNFGSYPKVAIRRWVRTNKQLNGWKLGEKSDLPDVSLWTAE